MGNPLLPLERKALTPRDAADFLNGLAAMVEAYPTNKVLLSINIEVATTPDAPKGTASSKTSSRRRKT